MKQKEMRFTIECIFYAVGKAGFGATHALILKNTGWQVCDWLKSVDSNIKEIRENHADFESYYGLRFSEILTEIEAIRESLSRMLTIAGILRGVMERNGVKV